MPIKIRLQRHGGKKRPFYFIVVADENAPRDGKFIEKIGSYNPLTIPATVLLKSDRALYWLQNGAIPTETCKRILSFKGVLYLKHLMRGVKLGLFDEATALEKFESWNENHEKEVLDRNEKHKADKKSKRDQIMKDTAVVKKIKVDEPEVAEAAPTEEVEANEEIVVAEAAPTTDENTSEASTEE